MLTGHRLFYIPCLRIASASGLKNIFRLTGCHICKNIGHIMRDCPSGKKGAIGVHMVAMVVVGVGGVVVG
jgi:uncharacterized membrane protein SpoIIM required for sporulation